MVELAHLDSMSTRPGVRERPISQDSEH